MSKFQLTIVSFTALISLAACASGYSQVPANYLTPSAQSGPQTNVTLASDVEMVNNVNGSLMVTIPLLHLPGVNGMDLNLGVNYVSNHYDLYSFAFPTPQGGEGYENTLQIGLQWGPARAAGGLTIPSLSFQNRYAGLYNIPLQVGGSGQAWVYCYSGYLYMDDDGSQHTFTNQENCFAPGAEGPPNIPTITTVSDSLDGSFMRLDTSNLSDIKLYKKNGQTVHFTGGPTSISDSALSTMTILPSYIIDPNGNTISFSQANNTITQIRDTVGRIVTLSPTGISYTDSNGTPRTISFSQTYVSDTNTLSLNATGCEVPNLGSAQVAFQNPVSMVPSPPSGHYNTLINIPTGSGSRTYTVVTDSLGEPTEVIYPTGGYTKYDYAKYTNVLQDGTVICQMDVRQVLDKRQCTSSSGTCSVENTTTYTPNVSAFNNSQMTVLEPANAAGIQRQTVYQYSVSGAGAGSPPVGAASFETSRTVSSYNASTGSTSQLQTTTTLYYCGTPPSLTVCAPSYNQIVGIPSNALPQSVTTSYLDISPQISSSISYQYDAVSALEGGGYGTLTTYFDNPNTVIEIGFSGQTIKTTNSSWNYGVAGLPFFNVLASSTVVDPSGWTSSQSYGFNSQGNMTSAAASGTNISSPLSYSMQRNTLGQLTSVTDPKNNTTTYSYNGPLYDGDCTTTSGVSAAPTSVIDALGHTRTMQYYSCTGLLAAANDVNSNLTSYTYDGMGAPLCASYPGGGSVCNNYNGYEVPFSVTTTRLATPDPPIVSTTTYDGDSRLLIRNLPNGAYTAVGYDSAGNNCADSNPSFTAPPSSGLSCSSSQNPAPSSSTDGITYLSYDALGRKTTQIDSDEVSTQTWNYSGSAVTYTDENGNQWQRTSDALGRLTKVLEPSGVSATPSLETDYAYNASNDLLSVTQWGGPNNSPAPNGPIIRSFAYDGLSRLTCASNPENSSAACPTTNSGTYVSGTTGYTYDADGNVFTKTSPAVNVASGTQTIGYCYDALNRMTYKFYSGAFSCTSPSGYAASYTYDTSSISGASNVIGKLTDETAYSGGTPTAERSPYNYDSMGRLIGEQQEPYSPSAPSYQFLYGYDLAGSVNCANNGFAPAPSSGITCANFSPVAGKSISEIYQYDGAGYLQSANVGTQPWSASSTYPAVLFQANGTTSTSYDAMGHLINWKLGISSTGAGIDLTRQYDNRARILSELDTGGASATDATASFTFSGTEQSTPATYSTGTLTFSGKEQTSGYASGRLTFSGSLISGMNGEFIAQIANCASFASFATGATPASLASTLASSINSSCSALVSATVSGAAVIIQSTTPGADGNYGLSITQNCNCSQGNPSTGLTLTASGADMIGGSGYAQASFTFSGALISGMNGAFGVTVGSCLTSLSFGTGATPTSLATSLATDINSSCPSLVTAQASGAVVTVTATTAGAASDYGVSATLLGCNCSQSNPSTGLALTASVPVMAGGGTVTYDSGGWGVSIGSGCSFQPAPGSSPIGYGAGSTPASLAAALVADINNTCTNVSALNSPGSPVVTLTSLTPGSGYDYSIGVSALGANASFTLTPSGSTMTLGANPTYDTGAYQVVLSTGEGSCTVNVPYGQGSTPATLATTLEANINSSCSPLVTASVNTATVTLTSGTAGIAFDYGVQASMTGGISSDFPSGSFALTPSGTGMTGGQGGTFYSYTVPSGTAGYAPNGNLNQFSDSVMGTWQFNYDTLNRLTTSRNTGVTTASSQFAGIYGCWTYDGFGNRTKEAYSTATATPCASGANDNMMLTSVTPTAKNQVSGFTYDGAGNVLNDNDNLYAYDPEGRICAVAVPNGTGGWYYDQYLYDAEGTRVAKGSAANLNCAAPTAANGFTLTNQYLLGQGGEQVTELNGNLTNSAYGMVHSNVFVGGKLLGTYVFTGNMGLHFALTDPLGTKRVEVSGAGEAELNCLSLPFGNNLGNNRTTDCISVGIDVSGDTTEHHFTGKERDTVT